MIHKIKLDDIHGFSQQGK